MNLPSGHGDPLRRHCHLDFWLFRRQWLNFTIFIMDEFICTDDESGKNNLLLFTRNQNMKYFVGPFCICFDTKISIRMAPLCAQILEAFLKIVV
jgi:hypothetical protein